MFEELTKFFEEKRLKGEIWALEKMQSEGGLSLELMKRLASLKAQLRNLQGLEARQGARAGEQTSTSFTEKAGMSISTLLIGGAALYLLMRGRK